MRKTMYNIMYNIIYNHQKSKLLEATLVVVVLSIIITISIAMMIATKSVVYAAANSPGSHVFNINDFTIKNFGIDNNRNLFLNVLGQAGNSKPTNMEQLFTYLFFTNNGLYAASVSEEPSSINSAAKITLDGNNCIISSKDIAKTDIHGNTISITDIPSSPMAIHKVETVQFNIDDTGTCIAKVFDSAKR